MSSLPEDLTSNALSAEEQKFKGLPGYAEASLENASRGGTYKVCIQAVTHKNGTMTGRIELSRSGSDNSSEGDTTAFICRKCKKVVDPSFVSSTFFSCPTCGATGTAAEGLRVDLHFTHMPMDVLAKGVEYYWRAANGNASIYLLRYKAGVARKLNEAAKRYDQKMVERYKAQLIAGKEAVLYPLTRIMKDNLSGMDMRARFKSFLQA